MTLLSVASAAVRKVAPHAPCWDEISEVRTVAEIWGQEGHMLWAGGTRSHSWAPAGRHHWPGAARSSQGISRCIKEVLEGSGALLSLQFKPLQDGQSNLEAK